MGPVNSAWVYCSPLKSQNMLLGEKKKGKKCKLGSATDTQYYQFEFLLFGCVCIYIYVYIHLKINKLVYYISYNNDGNNAVGLVNSEC